MITPRSALNRPLCRCFAQAQDRRSGRPAADHCGQHIDFAELAALVDGLVSRGDGRKGGRPTYPTEVMVRALVLKRLYNLSDEQMEYQLLDRMSYQRFCLQQDSMNVPDRNTNRRFAQCIGADGAVALLQGVDAQLQRYGDIARGGQGIDATLVPAPRQHIGKVDKERLEQGKDPDWSDAKRRQKDLDAPHQEARQELLWRQAQRER